MVWAPLVISNPTPITAAAYLVAFLPTASAASPTPVPTAASSLRVSPYASGPTIDVAGKVFPRTHDPTLSATARVTLTRRLLHNRRHGELFPIAVAA